MHGMKKVAIIGSSGSGKSTLAARLQRELDIPLFHLDVLYWRPDWVKTPKQDWVRLQKDITSRPEWIIDGNYGGTIDIRLNAADTIIFLRFSRLRCLWGILKRFVLRNRVDTISGCSEKLDFEFVKWVWHYNRESAPKMDSKLRKLPEDKQIHVFRTRRQLERFCRRLRRDSETTTR